jgi:hypothetical protein
MSAARELECQERKDEIFSRISLIDWGGSAPLMPDYTQTEFEVAVSFFQALLNAWKYQSGAVSLWGIPYVGNEVVHMLQLDNNSAGVSSALGARAMMPGMYLVGEETNVKCTHSHNENSTGWRVSSGHLTKSDSGFWTWSPPWSDKSKVYLPFWVKNGDWIVVAGENPIFTSFVLVGEAVEGFGGPLIGHAVSDTIDTEEEVVGVNFGIHWDPEDLVIYSTVEDEMMKLASHSERYSAEWVRALNTAVCRNRTPGSSYAFRCDGMNHIS